MPFSSCVIHLFTCEKRIERRISPEVTFQMLQNKNIRRILAAFYSANSVICLFVYVVVWTVAQHNSELSDEHLIYWRIKLCAMDWMQENEVFGKFVADRHLRMSLNKKWT